MDSEHILRTRDSGGRTHAIIKIPYYHRFLEMLWPMWGYYANEHEIMYGTIYKGYFVRAVLEIDESYRVGIRNIELGSTWKNIQHGLSCSLNQFHGSQGLVWNLMDNLNTIVTVSLL